MDPNRKIPKKFTKKSGKLLIADTKEVLYDASYEISTLLLSYVVPVKSKVEILQNFVAFSEYMNFTYYNFLSPIFLLIQTQLMWLLVRQLVGKL